MNKTEITPELINEIIELKDQGLSSREIGNLLNCAKTTVNKYYNIYKNVKLDSTAEVVNTKGPKILFIDLETAPSIAAVFGRFKQNVGQDAVVQEGGQILTAAWKWLGDEKAQSIYAQESEICAVLFDLASEADAIVAHNNYGYDYKVLQTRLMINGFNPLPTTKLIDTLIMAKKNFKFSSNKLDSIAQVLGIGQKKQTGGMKLWLDVMQAKPEAIKTMLEYNEQDVELLEKIYLRLRAWGHKGTNFNAGHYYGDDKVRCHICGSDQVLPTGRDIYTQVSRFVEHRCVDCGAVSRNRQTDNSKEKRASILVP